MQRLLEEALSLDERGTDPLYQTALAVEQDERLSAEMLEWDATSGDGLARAAPGARRA